MRITSYIEWNFSPKQRKSLLSNEEIDKYSSRYSKINTPRVLAIIQARTSSTRFPNKIFAQLDGAPILFHVINRVCLSSYISTAVVATTEEELEVPEGVNKYVYPGPVEDVLGRYFFCSLFYEPDYVVRITSDCPTLDPLLIDYVVYQAVMNRADYCSNVLDLTFPDGQDIEVMSMNLLKFLQNNVFSKDGREHVTWAFRKNPDWQDKFRVVSIMNKENLSNMKCSIDTQEDLQNVEKMNIV